MTAVLTRSLWLSVALVALMVGQASAGRYGDANRAYQEGRFLDAVDIYEQLVEDGVVHEDLFYNLGNAWFRAGNVGAAIHNYLRALRIDPHFEDAEFNLKVARSVVADRGVRRLKDAEKERWWIRAVTFFSVTELTVAFLALNVLLFSCLIALRFLATGFLRTAVIVGAIFLALSCAGSGVFLNRHLYVLSEIYQGVVIADRVTMREGPGHELQERGQLHPGLMVRILDHRDGWLRVRLADDHEGWVPVGAVGRL